MCKPLVQVVLMMSLLSVPWSVQADVITGQVPPPAAGSKSVPPSGSAVAPADTANSADSLFDTSGATVLRVSATPVVRLTDANVFKLSPEYVVNFSAPRDKLSLVGLGSGVSSTTIGNVNVAPGPGIIGARLPVAVPEPSTLLLLAAGLAVTARRLKARGERRIRNPHL